MKLFYFHSIDFHKQTKLDPEFESLVLRYLNSRILQIRPGSGTVYKELMERSRFDWRTQQYDEMYLLCPMKMIEMFYFLYFNNVNWWNPFPGVVHLPEPWTRLQTLCRGCSAVKKQTSASCNGGDILERTAFTLIFRLRGRQPYGKITSGRYRYLFSLK